MTTLQFYTRRDCHLCEAAWFVVQRVVAGRDIAVEKIDIESDPALVASYGDHIPVIVIDGVERFRHRVVERELRGFV